MKNERRCDNCAIYKSCPTMKEVKEKIINDRNETGIYNRKMWELLEERAFHQCEIRGI